MSERRRVDPVTEEEMVEEIQKGEATDQELDEKLRERMRREAAEREDLPDDTERHEVEGFGSGQGMGRDTTGQEPDRPDDQGFPRGQDKKWPH